VIGAVGSRAPVGDGPLPARRCRPGGVDLPYGAV